MSSISELRAEVDRLHNEWMYHEAAEREYDPDAAEEARQKYVEAIRRLREAEIAGTSLEVDLAAVRRAQEAYREIMEVTAHILVKRGFAGKVKNVFQMHDIGRLLEEAVRDERARLWEGDVVEP